NPTSNSVLVLGVFLTEAVFQILLLAFYNLKLKNKNNRNNAIKCHIEGNNCKNEVFVDCRDILYLGIKLH
ncbi:MAG: hypothetical protein OEM80_02545, partial [Desulfobulbaceae bacterium]|nr:hypothetical protein [Desulfobulbaceae bacterium]